MTLDNEQQLVKAVVKGDQHALGRLLELMQPRLFNVCLRMLGNRDDAAEVTQEAMLKIIEHVHDFRHQANIATWMIRIAMNLSISQLRKRKVRLATSLEYSQSAHPTGHDDQSATLRQQIEDRREQDPSESVQQKEMLAHLQTALTSLDEEFRSVLVLRDIEEMDYQQIATVLDVPIGTVKSRLFRARLALRHEMLKLCPPPKPAASAREVTHG
jgi:RNA polymerase sigma-70 factor (ECF subfamily)